MKPMKNKQERIDHYLKHYKDQTYDEMAKVFGHKNGEVTRAWAKKLNLPNKKINSQSKRANGRDRKEELIGLLTKRGRTEKELQKIGFNWSDARRTAENVKGYTLYIQRNDFNEKVMVLIREYNEKIEVLPRAFDCSFQPTGQPYLWVKFPFLSNGNMIDKLKLFPLSDFHYGHKSCNKDKILQDVEFIRQNKEVYAFLNGDIIENASKLSIASGVYEQDTMPDQQISDIVRILAPIAHKIIFYIQGNHEERVYRHLGIDIGRVIADKLNIPYFNEPVYVDLLWRDYRWLLFSQHGASSSRTKGGKMNAAAKPIKWTDFTNFIVYGHVHDKISNEIVRIVRDPVNFRLIEKKQYVVVCSAYLNHFGTYGARKGYEPVSKGRSILKMYSNGEYYVGA